MPDYIYPISSKLPGIETSIFSVMSKLAFEQNAINLSQGYPDFKSSQELIELVYQFMNNGFNQYAPMPGVIGLREVICEKMENLYGAVYHPETEITITAGATQAIFTAITAVVRQDDEVILFGPSYDCYEPAVRLNGGKIEEIELLAPDYRINWEKVKQTLTEKTRMIIINTPHNPTGTVLLKKDMELLQALVKNTDIIILSDEVYEHIIFDGIKHQSVARFPELAKRSFVIASFGKTFHNTGWKTGYCLAPEKLMNEFKKVHQFNVFSVNHPIQKALEVYMKNPDTYLSLGRFYQEKRNYFLDLIKDSRFSFTPSQGTYFQLLSYAGISDEKDTAFAVQLTKEFKIASIPVSVFYKQRKDDHVLRFCFAKSEEILEKGAEILNKI